jgi:membrane associated rhomboid family serine protease
MLIPYKVKNPPRRFPVVTAILIAANFVVFFLTSDGCVVIRNQVLDSYVRSWGENQLLTLFAGMFLHADIVHILGNMLFLCVFGPAVEDRLGKGVYLLLYFLAGFAGDVAQGALGAGGGSVPTLGASGCIMGLLGAYWWIYSWSRVCCIAMLFVCVIRFEAAAIWVVSGFVALDVIRGLAGRQIGASGGVANFAHVGGAVLGAFLVWSLGIKRDTSDVSQVKAVQSDTKHFGYLDFDEMKKLVAASPDDHELTREYARKAFLEQDDEHMKHAMEIDPRLCVTDFPLAVAEYLRNGAATPIGLMPSDLQYLGRECERLDKPQTALAIYDTIVSTYPDSPDAEMALYRSAAVFWRAQGDRVRANQKLDALRTIFPSSHLTFDAEDLQAEIERRHAA